MGAPGKSEHWSELSMCWWSVVEQDQARMCHSVPMKLIRNARRVSHHIKCEARRPERSMATTLVEGEKRY